ncbi:MAG TPA: pyruvate kinase [Candidatus Dojkabacteria bacterium]
MIKTKIVCTIGPSSWDDNVLRRMIAAGMTVARINGAFADIAELKRVGDQIRNISDDVALMLDIKGHEVRLNKFAEDKKFNIGDKLTIGSTDQDEIYPITYPDLYKDVKTGDVLLFDDGNLEAKVIQIEGGKIICEIISGEILSPGKSINTPTTNLNNPPLTERDIEQIQFIKENNWDFVAASFVRKIDDVKGIQDQLQGSSIKIIAKIEDDEGVKNIDEIIDEVYGIMIARGDMGVEMPFEKIPFIQKDIIKKCNKKGKPVITATQMMDSMIRNPKPTRAEILDVANAIIDGTDAIMTSAETTKGEYPAETIEAMARIASEVESNVEPSLIESSKSNSFSESLTRAAFELTNHSEIAGVVVVEATGRTSSLLGRYRIKQPIISFVSDEYSARSLSLSKGVVSEHIFSEKFEDRDLEVNSIKEEIMKLGIISAPSKILIIVDNVLIKGVYKNIFEIVEIN